MIKEPVARAASDRPMTLIEHLDELRKRLALCLLALVIGVAVAFSQVERIIGWLKAPAADRLPHFIFFAPTEALSAYLKVAGLAGLVVAMPVILWQVWAFVRIALTPLERAWGGVFVFFGTILFVAGVAFAYFVLLPASLSILLGIGKGILEPMLSIDRYLSFVLALLSWCGVTFELPVVIFILAKVGIVTPEWLRQQRPYAILVLVTAAALLTPTTDVVNQLLMTIPLVVLYEVSIPLAALAAPKSVSAEAAEGQISTRQHR